MPNTVELVTRQNNMPAFDLAAQLCERYKNRGLVKEIADCDREFEAQMQKTADEYGAAYSLWSTDERVIDVKYRSEDADGNRYMDSDGFVRYFKDCQRISDGVDHTESIYVDESYDKDSRIVRSPVSELVSAKDMKNAPTTAIERVSGFVGEWISPERERKAEKSSSSRPSLPTWLSVIAVFVSFMLIVASSIMVGVETGSVSEMRSELASLEDEKAELELELEVKNDLVSIYDVATNDLGMISENSVSVKYLPESEEDTVKNFEDEDDGRIDLATILSAIGIRR